MSLVVRTANAGETRALGQAVGTATQGGLLILLSGDYGSGKTTFVQGLAAGLGCVESPRSPSYLIVRVHEDGRLPLVHADLYRVRATAEIEELGLVELAGESGVIAVEWPGDAGPLAIPERPCLSLHFNYIEGRPDERCITVEWSGDMPPAIITALHAASSG